MKGRGTSRALVGPTYAPLEPNLGLALMTVMHELMLAVKLPRPTTCGISNKRTP